MKLLQKKFIFSLIFCAIQLHCLHGKKFGGGGGGFRGGGAARANPAPAGGHFGGGGAPAGGGQPHFAGGGGGFHGPAGGGGFHPQPAGGFHGTPMSAGSGPGRFGGGTGLGSSNRAGTFTSALAGAAVGTAGTLLAIEAGKAIFRSPDRPFNHDGRDYYLNEEHAKKRHGEIQCKMPWNSLVKQSAASNQSTNGTSQEQLLANATFQDGTRPKEIVWTCKENVEICCGMDCCPNPQYTPPSNSEGKSGGGIGTFGKVLLGILIVALLCCCCCALLTYTSCRSVFDSCMPGNSNNNNNQNYDQSHPYKYDGAGDNVQNAQTGQSYPMQPYYPPPPSSNNYPAQPQAPAAYPPAPTYPQATAVYPPAPNSYPQAPGY